MISVQTFDGKFCFHIKKMTSSVPLSCFSLSSLCFNKKMIVKLLVNKFPLFHNNFMKV